MTIPLEERPADPRRVRRLRALRAALSLTQEEVAKAAGLSRVQVNKIENGWDKASKHFTVAALARGLGVEVVELDAVLGGSVSAKAMAAKVSERRAAGEAAK